MNAALRLAFAASLSLGAATVASAAECKMIGSVGSGVTEGMARIMAEGGLKNIISNRNMTPTGAIKVTCEAGAIVTECSARQLACK